ncbi:MAG: yvfH [Bacillales bacterium]|jgi:lactate permease|nr:yvfH [Bacillales bacterium]
MTFTGELVKSAEAVNGSLWLSALVALIPILFFFWALAIKKMKGYKAGISTLLIAMVLSIFLFKMPVMMAVMVASKGALYGFLPIGWIILNSVFLYKLTVKTGQFEIIKNSILSITEDRRLQVVLVAFSFGAFLEGAAGFGAPVAITAALLIGLGFKPLYAAGLCLIANTAPVAFGALGAPIIAFGNFGYDVGHISQIIGRQLPFLSVFIPIYIVIVMVGFKKTKEVMPALLVAGGSFALVQYFSTNFMGPELPDVVSSIASIVCLVLFLKVWKPKNIYRFEDEGTVKAASVASRPSYTGGQILKAWSPFIILTGMVTVWGLPNVKLALGGNYVATMTAKNLPVVPFYETLDHIGHAFKFLADVPFVSGDLFKMVNGVKTAEVFQYKVEFLAAAGTAILFSAVISKFILGISWADFCKTFGQTLKEVALPLVTIMSVVAYSDVANQSGMMLALGSTLAATGAAFKFLSPVLGWLGVFVTGSDTSANLLFGGVQYNTAVQVGMDPFLALAANASGGVTGKMISPQSIAVACAAVGLSGKESDLLRFTLKHSFYLLLVICVIVWLQTNVLSWMLPVLK